MNKGAFISVFAAALFCAQALAAIPVIKVTTKDNKEPVVTSVCTGQQSVWGCSGTSYNAMEYVELTKFELTDPNNSAYNLTRTAEPDSIRRRGNSTATMSKAPFRVKFDKKTSLFGKEAAKSWVLLANYYDTTLILNAAAFELGKRLGLAFTPTSQMVDLYLNDKYLGIYQLTEQVQVNKGRVDIDKDNGWFVEFDYHDPDPDEIHFTTSKYNLGTFIKSPEDLPSQSGYQFVKDDINALCEAMYSNGFPENGYRNLLDLEGWAKYTLVQLFMDNFDFNSKVQSGGLVGSNYAYKDAGGRIFAGPLWDFDLAGGVSSNQMTFPAHYVTYQDQITPRHDFYKRMFQDPVFLAKWKKNWDNNKSSFESMPSFIDSIATALEDRVEANFSAYSASSGNWGWGGIGGGGGGSSSLTKQGYINEVAKLKTWWNSRLAYFDQQINSMNINTEIETQNPEPSSSSRDPSSSSNPGSSSNPSSSSSPISPIAKAPKAQISGMFMQGGSVNIYASEPSSAKIYVFDLSGKLLFSASEGKGSAFSWNLGSKGLGLGSKTVVVYAEVKGQSGKRTYKALGKFLH